MSSGEIEMSKEHVTSEIDTREHVERVPSVEVDNYHGLTLKCCLVYLAIEFVAFAQMMVIVSSGLLARYMAADIGGVSKVQWLAQTATIVNLALCNPVAQGSDFWGRKWPLILTCGFGAIGSLIISRADNMNMAIAGNVLASISTASQPLTFAVASEILPRRYRSAASGGINGILSIAAMVSLLAGAALTKEYFEGWRIIWYINTGLFGAAALITLLLYNPPPRKIQVSLALKDKLRRLDWVGIAILSVGLVLFVVGLTWSENPYSWDDAHVLVPFIVGAVLLFLLVVWETRFKMDGLFHHGLFSRDRNCAIAIFATFIEGTAFFAANNFFPYQVSVLFETDPVRVSLRFTIVFIAATVSAFAVSIYSSWRKSVRWPLVTSFICISVFFGAMISVDFGSSNAVWGFAIFLGIGLGSVLTLVVPLAQFSAPPELISLSTAAMIGSRALGASIGLPVYNAIFNSLIMKNLPEDIAAAVLPLGLPPNDLPQFIAGLAAGNNSALASIPGVTPEIVGAGVHGLQAAYIASFRAVYIAAFAISLTGVIACLFVIDPTTEFTMHVDASLEGDEYSTKQASP